MKVLITGGAGFIGSHLVEKFLDSGFEVRVLDIKSSPENLRHLLGNDKLKYIEGDIRDKTTCLEAMRGCDYVAHLAALISVDQSIADPPPFWDTNVGGTINLLEAARKLGIQRFHFMSSCEMMGHIDPPLKANEDSPTYIPRSPYAASKFAAETYCHSYYLTYRLPIIITRCFNIFGPRQDSSSQGAVIPRFIVRILSGKPPVIFGSGEQTRDWTFVTDIAEGVFLVLTSELPALFEEDKDKRAPLFVLATGKDYAVNDVVRRVIKAMNVNLEPVHETGRPGEMMRSTGDYSKANRLLGWRPKVSFEDGLVKTIEYFKNHPGG